MQVEKKVIEGKEIPWLSKEDYDHAVGTLRQQLVGIFSPFNSYGLQAFIPGAKEAVIKLAEDFALRVRGIDHPIDFYDAKNKSGFRESGNED